MIDYLTATDVPITEGAPIYEVVWRDRAIRRVFKVCETCRAWGSAPCRTKSGKVTARHARRPR
jgi:hypothetical protein